MATGIAGVVYGSLGLQTLDRPSSPSGTASSSSPPEESAGDVVTDVVDESVVEAGWVPEPVTTSIQDYAVSAARAGTSYDTTLATRDQLIDYLASWHTEDSRLASQADRDESLEGKIELLDDYVIVPPATWDEQAAAKAILTAAPEGDVRVDYDHVSIREGSLDNYIADGFHDVTVDLVVTYSQVDSSTGERLTYDDRITVSMQLQCGSSLPAPGSGQSPADCKLIRYYQEPLI